MGTLLFAGPDSGLALEGHEGYLEFRLDEPVIEGPYFAGGHPTPFEGWTSTWTVMIDAHRVGVRAACECGWHGPELPWLPGLNETEAQHDALMAPWLYEHAGPLRDRLETS